MKKRILSILICLCMAAALLPATALAADTYTVTYDYAGGTAVGDVPTVEQKSGNVTLPGKGVLTRDNYTFVGWSDGAKGYLPGDTYTVSRDVTLTALWASWNFGATGYVKIGNTTLNNSTPYYHNGASSAAETADNNATGASAMLVDGVLVLNGLDVIGSDKGIWWSCYKEGGQSAGVQENSKYDLIIYLLPGTSNTVTNTGGPAIHGEAESTSGPSLIIQGSGTLEATGSSYGIQVWKYIDFKGGAQVTAKGQTSGIANNASSSKITVTGPGTQVTANGAATAAGGAVAYGICNESSGNNGTLAVENGATFIASGATSALHRVAYDSVTNWTVFKAGDNESLAQEVTDTSNLTQKYVKITAAHAHRECGVVGLNCSHTGHTSQTWTKWESTNALPGTAGSYYLTGDVTLTGTWTVPSGDTAICLNGHTITGASNQDAITVETGRTLTVTDCAEMQGKITHISGQTGRGVYVKDAAFHLYGGTISGNAETGDDVKGGGVCLSGTSAFTMTGGEIKYNTATDTNSSGSGGGGGGVYLSGTSAFTMTGGTISGNTVSGDNAKGGGVYVGNSSTFTVSGNVKITGNTKDSAANNVYLTNEKTITVSKTLTGGTGSIGVTTANDPTSGSPVTFAQKGGTYSLLENDRAAFTPDLGTGYSVELDSDALKLCAATAATPLTGTVTITGEAKFDQQLTANVTNDNHTGTLSYQWKRGGSEISGATGTTYTLVEADIGNTITVVVTSSVETGSIQSSATAAVQKADAPAAPTGLSGVAPTTENGTDGKITGTTDAMEYSTENTFSSSTDCTATATTGLSAGTYYVRVKGTATQYAGTAATVTVPAYTAQPAYGISLSQTGTYTFTEAKEGYTEAPTALTVTVTNTGNQATGPLTVALSGTNADQFTLTGASIAGIADTNGTADFTVRPETGLSAGTYTATVTVSGGNSISASFTVRFTVAAGLSITYTDDSAVTDPKVGETLKANMTDMPTGATYQWCYDDGATNEKINGATGATYTLTAAEQGKFVGVYIYPQGVTTGRPLYSKWLTTRVTAAGTPVTPSTPSTPVTPSNPGSYTPPTYRVESVSADDPNGSVSLSGRSAGSGDTVTITVTPNPHYRTVGVIVRDGDGNVLDVTENDDGTFSFEMPAGPVTVEPVFAWENPFEDVPENAYYTPAVEWALKRGITNGTGSGSTFSAAAPCTRAELVVFLWRASGSPEPEGSGTPFTDVPADADYARAVQWAYEKGLTGGIGAGFFSPDAACTRGQMATFLHRMAGLQAPEGSANPFTDVPDAYYTEAVQWAYEQSITDGTSATTFSPDIICDRGQVVVFLYRFFAE